MNVYLNVNGSTASSTITGTPPVANNNPHVLFALTAFSRYINCYLYKFLLYDRNLSSDDQTLITNNGIAKDPIQILLPREGTGATLKDLSKYRLNATAVNYTWHTTNTGENPKKWL
jgi:hypothetical protein